MSPNHVSTHSFAYSTQRRHPKPLSSGALLICSVLRRSHSTTTIPTIDLCPDLCAFLCCVLVTPHAALLLSSLASAPPCLCLGPVFYSPFILLFCQRQLPPLHCSLFLCARSRAAACPCPRQSLFFLVYLWFSCGSSLPTAARSTLSSPLCSAACPGLGKSLYSFSYLDDFVVRLLPAALPRVVSLLSRPPLLARARFVFVFDKTWPSLFLPSLPKPVDSDV